MPPESRTRRTWLRGSSRQTIGTSATWYPRRRASHSTSASKPNRSRRCRPNSSRAAGRRNALNPHWLSRIPGKSRSETSPLKVRPASPRSQGCRTRMSDPASAAGPDGDVRAPLEGGAELRHLLDRRREIRVREQDVRVAGDEHAPAHAAPLAGIPRASQHRHETRRAPELGGDVARPVDTPVVDDDDLHGLGEAPRILDQPAERAGQPTRLVVRRHDDRETRRGSLRSVRRLWLHRDSARLPAPIGRTRHGYHARAPSMGA